MIKRVSTLTLLGLIIGGVVGLLAVAFVDIVLWLNDRLFVSQEARVLAPNRSVLVAMTIGIPTVGGLLVGLLAQFIPDQRFHGPMDAIRTAQSLDEKMPVKTGIISTLAACLSLGSGASVGQYGPLAHMGASIGSWINRATGGDRSLGKIGLACGAAAAISAAFHAPIAGLVFSREVVLRHYSLRAFAPIAVAATLGYVVASVIFQRTPLFEVGELAVASPYEYLVFIIMGISGAVVATLFMRAIEFAGGLANQLTWPVPIKTALAGLALGIVALQVPEILGIGQTVLREAMLGDVFSAADLVIILVAKLLLTALCLGAGFAGGVFSPALLIGTLFGALIGGGAEWFVSGAVSPIAVYAVCGMVAVISPVIGAPLTTVLIVFELTHNYDLATVAMVSVAFANLIGYRIYGRSFFDVQLQKQGFDLSHGRGKVAAQQHLIGELLTRNYTTGAADDTLADVREALIKDNRSEAYIVDSEGKYQGTLTLHRLMKLTATGTPLNQPAGPHAEPESLLLSPDTSVWAAMETMEDFVGESIPVLADERIVGVLFESTIVGAYLEILEDTRKEENEVV